MFDTHNTERLTKWKQFRNSLETSATPLEDVAELWSHAPFVSPYLDPHDPTKWPDPWHLIMNSDLDGLAIVLGMLYTIKLTRRFIDTPCEIHKSMLLNNKELLYLLIVDNRHVLNLEYGGVVGIEQLARQSTSMIYSKIRL